VTVTEKHVEAVNSGDVDGAEAKMKEEAVVTVPQATSGTEGEEAEGEAETEPEAQTQYTGAAEYQAWLDAQAVAKAQTTLGACSVEGERVTCPASYTSNALRAKGVDFLEGMLAVRVVEGKIQSYAFTPSPKSVIKLRAIASAPAAVPVTGGAAAPEAMPVSGGGVTQGITFFMTVLAVLGLLLAGATSTFRGAKN
jgi:hypothetical protein